MSREALCAEWQESLKKCECFAKYAPLRMRWLYAARARIYRVLISMYGESFAHQSAWEVPERQAIDDFTGNLQAANVRQILPGKNSKLKDRGQILRALKSVAIANETVASGKSTADDYFFGPLGTEQPHDTARKIKQSAMAFQLYSICALFLIAMIPLIIGYAWHFEPPSFWLGWYRLAALLTAFSVLLIACAVRNI